MKYKPQINLSERQKTQYINVKYLKNGKPTSKGFGRAEYWDNWDKAFTFYMKLVNVFYLNKYRNMAKRHVKDFPIQAITEIVLDPEEYE